MTKATIFVEHLEDAADFDLVSEWLEKWKDSVHVESYSTGGWEHLWDIEAPDAALAELPQSFFCSSAWAGT